MRGIDFPEPRDLAGNRAAPRASVKPVHDSEQRGFAESFCRLANFFPVLIALENKLIDTVVALDNIKWWHRIIEKKGFRLNGFINHYPDFLVMTKSGKTVLIEYKGDDRDNSNSARKLKLGRKWQAQCGPEYRYFMVFKNRNFGIDGAYTLDRFVEIMREL